MLSSSLVEYVSGVLPKAKFPDSLKTLPLLIFWGLDKDCNRNKFFSDKFNVCYKSFIPLEL
jgi:hypothetical protein